MPLSPPRPPAHGWRDYLRLTRTATYGFVSALPLLVLYEVMIFVANRGTVYQVRVGAEVWIKHLLAMVGLTGLAALGVLVVAGGIVVVLLERRQRIPLRPRYLAALIAESGVYAILIAWLVARLVGLIFSLAPDGSLPDAPGTWTLLALSIGAGLYEELFFRVLLVGGLFLLFRRLGGRPVPAYAGAALLGALVFSAVHYVGPLGDPFTLGSFTFRFLFGLALNAVFLLRGFGVAAWTHALYDVLVVAVFAG